MVRVSFYEEFPGEGFAKCSLVPFKADLFVACHNLAEFRSYSRQLKRYPHITPCYWPVLAKEEGYWMSPFAERNAVKRVIDELEADRRTLRVTWDAEPPLRRGMLVFVWRAPGTARLINSFVAKTHHELLFTENAFLSRWGGVLGFSKDVRSHRCHKTLMVYSSFLAEGVLRDAALRTVRTEHEKLGDRLSVGLGCIAPGIHGDERIISVAELRRDLDEMRHIGIAEVIIYRLGGLTKKCAELLGRYAAVR